MQSIYGLYTAQESADRNAHSSYDTYKSIFIGKDKVTDDAFESLVQESISSMFVTDIDFESFPRMTFDGERCDWDYIMQREVLGPFAPKSGWIAALRKDSINKGRSKLNKGFMQAVGCAMLEKAMPKSRMARALKKQQTFKLQLEMEETEKLERVKSSISKQEKSERRFKYGQICHIFNGCRVQPTRRFSELPAELPQMLTLGAGILPISRCRSCNCRNCKRKKAGIEYMFDVPKPYELNQRWLIREKERARTKNALLIRPAPIRKTSNRYGGLMTPLLTSQSHIAELRKQQEVMKAAQAKASKEDSLLLPLKTLGPGIPFLKVGDSPMNKQATVDLTRSPVCKRRATLKMALAEASNIHNKLSAFAAALPERKEHAADSSSDDESSTPSSQRRNVISLTPLSPGGTGPRPNKISSFQNVQKVSAVKKNLLALDSEAYGVAIKDKIEEAVDAENTSVRKSPPKEAKKTMRCAVFADLEKQRCNRTLFKYVTTKLEKISAATSPKTSGGVASSATSVPSTSTAVSRQHKKAVSNIIRSDKSLKEYLGTTLPVLGKNVRNGGSSKSIAAATRTTIGGKTPESPWGKRRLKATRSSLVTKGIYAYMPVPARLHI